MNPWFPPQVPTLDAVRADPTMEPFVCMLRSAGHPTAEAGEPARADDIARFEALVPHPLPPLYRAWLERFGEGGPIYIAIGDGRGELSEVLAYYARKPDRVPDDAVIIAAPRITEATALLYAGRDEPAVGYSEGFAIAPTFAHHLYRQGWFQTLGPDGAQMTVRDVEADALADALQRAGFERLWFSGGEAHCLDGAVVQMFLREEQTCTRVFVLSRLQRERDRWAEWVQRRYAEVRRFR